MQNRAGKAVYLVSLAPTNPASMFQSQHYLLLLIFVNINPKGLTSELLFSFLHL